MRVTQQRAVRSCSNCQPAANFPPSHSYHLSGEEEDDDDDDGGDDDDDLTLIIFLGRRRTMSIFKADDKDHN